MDGLLLALGLLVLMIGGFGLLALSPRVRSWPIDYPIWGAMPNTSRRVYRWRVMRLGFPVLSLPGCQLRSGEVALLAGRARLELPGGGIRETYRSHKGQEIPCLGMAPIGWGRLVVTSERLLFVGTDDSLSLPFGALLNCSTFARGLFVETSGGGVAYFFRFPYAPLFVEALALLTNDRWQKTSRQAFERVRSRPSKRWSGRKEKLGPSAVRRDQRRGVREALGRTRFLGAAGRSSEKPF